MTDYSELKRLADRVISDRRFCGDENHKALADGVMALIAEIEFLTESRQEAREERNKIGDRHDALEAERDQLKAENDALRKAVLEAREFIMHEAEVRGLLDENNEVSFRHPRRQAAIAVIDAAMGKGEQS
ncbi:hypothetical protein [Pseudomonas sp. 11/12A]|uniref:hypothetical protein n=1 Tax=Pseudomonas sp. 11/12A TaxID=1506582 RepID=UPI0006458E1A|nr:hypothetical protein [Pseudomonas sp. 11/12A]